MTVEKHFSRIWYVSMANVAICLMPLGLLGWVPDWSYFMTYFSVFTFTWFLGPQLAAGGVKTGFQGHKTDWLYEKFQSRWTRVPWAFVFSGVSFWRLPEFLYLNIIIGSVLLLWLPWHYWSKQTVSPVDYILRFILRDKTFKL